MERLQNLSVVYQTQDLVVTYQCHAADGSTPLNLSGGGVVEIKLFRLGQHPFSVEHNSDQVAVHEWVDRSLGQGEFTIKLSDLEEPLPVGFARLQLKSTTSDGRDDVQALNWFRVERTY
jgi:hypothetical protein